VSILTSPFGSIGFRNVPPSEPQPGVKCNLRDFNATSGVFLRGFLDFETFYIVAACL